MDQAGYNHLLDEIYAAVFEPQLWTAVIARIADAVGGNSGWMSQVSIQDGHGSGLMARCDPEMTRRYFDYYCRLNPLTNRSRPAEYMAHWRPSVNTLDDHLDVDGLVKTEYYNDFFKPQDIHTVLMIDLAASGFDMSSVNIHRGRNRGSFEADDLSFANGLHPHLARAFRLGGVFAKTRDLNGDAATALEHARHGVFILDRFGHVRHANGIARRVVARAAGLNIVKGKLLAAGAADRKKLQALIEMAGSADLDLRRGGSMVVSPDDARLPVSVMPLRPERLSVFTSGPSVLVTVNDLSSTPAVSDEELRALFKLSAAETRIVRALLGGSSPRHAADEFGVSVNTIRAQLANIFRKTGTASQAQLLLLVARLMDHSAQQG